AHGEHAGEKLASVRYGDLGPLSSGDPIPTLDEVIALAKETGVSLQVEIKDRAGDRHGERTALRIAGALEGALPRERFLVTAFDPDQIRAVEDRFGDAVDTALWVTKNVQTKRH